MNTTIFFNAGDAIAWASCRRRVWYDYHRPDGFIEKEDPFEALMQEKGLVHEQNIVDQLGPMETAASAKHTQELMHRRTPLIYQGLLVDEDLGVFCRPDFLRLEGDEYRAEDAKYASKIHDKPGQLAQLGCYDIVLGSTHRARAILIDGESYELEDKHIKKAKTFIEDMSVLVSQGDRPAANFVESKCKACPYKDVCVPEFKQNNNLGLNYFVDNRALPGLAEKGIRDLKDMAKANPDVFDDVPYMKRAEKRRNAVLQAQSLLERRVIRLTKTKLPQGQSIHFDVETYPFGADGKEIVYLWGMLVPPYGPEDFEYVWADQEDDEKGFLSFLDRIETYRDRFEKPVLVHYSPFEIIKIKMYAARYGLEDHGVVQWLLGDENPFFDIKTAISDSLILPVTGYGLKPICKSPELVNFQWELEESGSQWSVVKYEAYLNASASERESLKEEILSYNRDDVRGTRAQEVWLENLQL